MFKRGWRRRIEEATIGVLDPGESVLVGFPGETPEGALLWWLIDFLRRRYRVYLVVLTNSRVLVFSRVAAFSAFKMTRTYLRSQVSVTRWDGGRLILRGPEQELDVEVGVVWWPEVKRFRTELAG